jgi:tryptophan-rich sensory protein
MTFRFPGTCENALSQGGVKKREVVQMTNGRSSLAQAAGLAGWLALVFAAAALGAIASVDAGSFYAQLVRPDWAPPASAFGPVWSVLYLLMGVAAWLVWRHQGADRLRFALTLFIIQLCANALWSWLFFAWRNGALAFADVLVLLALIATTVVAFWRISRLAGILLVPYLAWVTLATALTWAVWQRNPSVL